MANPSPISTPELVKLLKSELILWIQSNEDLLMNERDMQVRIAKHLKDCGLFDSVITEYGVPLSELEARRSGIVGRGLFPWQNDISVDIVLEKEGRFAVLELKYTTSEVSTGEETIFGEIPKTDDVKTLKNHAAANIRMYDFWKDVRRIEILGETFENVDGGLALMITNNHTFWTKAKDSAKYRNFSMEEARLVGQCNMTWTDDVAESTVKTRPDFTLEGQYPCHWERTQIDDAFRYMIAEIAKLSGRGYYPREF